MSEQVWEGRDERGSATKVWLQVGLGMGIVLLEHLTIGGLLGGGAFRYGQMGGSPDAMSIFFVWLFGIGITQLGYVLPTFLIALVVRRNVAAGVALGALMTFLLNGACFGVLCGGLGGL